MEIPAGSFRLSLPTKQPQTFVTGFESTKSIGVSVEILDKACLPVANSGVLAVWSRCVWLSYGTSGHHHGRVAYPVKFVKLAWTKPPCLR